MNREIIFRGKSSDNDEWVQGHLHKKRNPFKEYFYIDTLKIGKIGEYNTIECVTEMVEPETIGQYIGINDKNGIKIFEGDIINGKDGTIILIKYTNTGFYPYRNQSGFSKITNWKNVLDGEVIGNIHDNKELLDSKTD